MAAFGIPFVKTYQGSTKAMLRAEKKKDVTLSCPHKDLLALHISRRAKKKACTSFQEDLGSCSCQNDITIQLVQDKSFTKLSCLQWIFTELVNQ